MILTKQKILIERIGCTRTGGGDPVRIDKNGQKSQKLFNDKVSVSINPDTGNLIQVNPYNR